MRSKKREWNNITINVTAGGTGGDSYGIYLLNASNNTLSNNSLSRNGGPAAGDTGYGIYMFGGHGNIIRNNSILSNKNDLWS